MTINKGVGPRRAPRVPRARGELVADPARARVISIAAKLAGAAAVALPLATLLPVSGGVPPVASDATVTQATLAASIQLVSRERDILTVG